MVIYSDVYVEVPVERNWHSLQLVLWHSYEKEKDHKVLNSFAS